MDQTYFLGANSRDGFVSLYGYFPSPEGDLLHIIKGGPGTGKSGFMRRIGAAAKERGLEVHTVLCSGDPDSLDGVYIPALHTAWVDGTAPHVIEPRCFGVDADYVNLGRFCRTPLSSEDQARVQMLNRSYRELYAVAYQKLAVASVVERNGLTPPDPKELLADVDEGVSVGLSPSRRFLHAISCQGELVLTDEIEKLCKQICFVPSSALALLSRELERRRLPVIRCPLPLDTMRLEAILLPWAGRAFVADWELHGLEPAMEALREAKALHDQLEAVYRPYMDWEGLTKFTEETLKLLFNE